MFDRFVDARKIPITGVVASGKSTFARQLADQTGLPLYELDTIAHPIEKSSCQSPMDEQIAALKEIGRKGKWIMEGTDRRHQRCLFEWVIKKPISIIE